MLPYALVLWRAAKFSAVSSTPFYSRTVDCHIHDCRRGCSRFVTDFAGTTALIDATYHDFNLKTFDTPATTF